MNTDIPSQIRSLYDKAPRHVQRAFRLWSAAVAALDAAPNRQKLRTARIFGRRLGVSATSVFTKRSAFRKHGAIALLDKRFSSECWPARKNALPDATVKYFQRLAAQSNDTAQGIVRAFKAQLRRWQRGDSSAKIPGYDIAPKSGTPPGWSFRNLSRYLESRPARSASYKIVLVVRNGVILSNQIRRLQ